MRTFKIIKILNAEELVTSEIFEGKSDHLFDLSATIENEEGFGKKNNELLYLMIRFIKTI